MIKSLHIENIAVIEKTDIDFCDRFNVLTGETGAGKSIIIDSINAVLGERTSKELIRTGCEKASVSALFTDLSDSSVKVIRENGFDTDEDGNLLILRTLSLGGSGSVKINGSPATVGILKNIAKELVNIHGQHDNQRLLIPENHYIYIDKIAENGREFQDYREEFNRLVSLKRELASIETDEGEKQRKIDLLKYQITELENAKIKPGEVETLKRQLKIADNYERTAASINEAYRMVCGSDDFDGALSLVKNSQKLLSTIEDSPLKDTEVRLADAVSALEDAAEELRGMNQDSGFADLDPEAIRTRLDILHTLMLKYGKTEEDMLAFLEQARGALSQIELSEERINELSQELDRSTERLVKLGDILTNTRKSAAEKFSSDVGDVLSYLDMPDVRFEVAVSKTKYTKNGCDSVEFMICTNAGDSLKPLHKIASGGELSRIMLAIKSVLAEKDDVDTLIFDEIDSGISGRAAGKVGVQLRNVAKCRQVLCVTHLAQIAAGAQNHLLIEKQVIDGKTYTSVKSLTEEERVRELARIMSGSDITENLYNSAKELLDRSK